MAAYPSFDQLYGSRKIPQQDIAVDVAPFGEFSTRTGYARADASGFTVLHILSAAQLATLNAAYLSHIQTVPIVPDTFTWDEDSTSHSVYWQGPPQVVKVSSTLYRVTVNLRRVIDGGSLVLESTDALLLESGDELLLELD